MSGSASVDPAQVIAEFSAGKPLGLVYPPRQNAPALPDMGQRESALRRLREFICRLPFMRTMGGPPQPFVVPSTNIHLYQPDNVVAGEEHKLPWIAFLPSLADNTDDGWLGPSYIIDGTDNIYAPDSSLFAIGWHDELLTIEVVSAKHSVRRAIVEGLKQVFRTDEDTGTLRLLLPNYFGQVVDFSLEGTEYVEAPDAVRNRRVGRLHVRMQMTEVALFSTVTMRPYVTALVSASVSTTVQTVVE